MNSHVNALDVISPLNAKIILAREGFQCSLIMLARGDETPLREAHDVEEHLLFVIDGEATVRFGDMNTMLNKDEALLIPKGKAHLIAAGACGWAKLLRVDVPPRQIVTPPLVTMER